MWAAANYCGLYLLPMMRTPISDLQPELVAGIPEERRELARERLLAPVESLRPGPWTPATRDGGGIGVLILDGLLMRDVVLGDTVATEIVGRGDILRPAQHDGAAAPVPFDVEWRVMQPTTLARLDRTFAAELAQWPEVVEAVVGAAVRRSQSLALHLAVCHMRRVHTRLLVFMWHMADRWGKVGTEGVQVPLKLSHRALGQLVGAQRPSVTTALRQLTAEGLVSRAADGTWLLHGDPPETLEQLREAAAARARTG
jgi:CRP/FNR family transcriptional regulator, cyclic AMP receptor protein